VNYSHFKDANGKWWWCILGPDGTVISDSGSGYVNEEQCLEAINRIQGSHNGGLERPLAAGPILTTEQQEIQWPKSEPPKTNATEAEVSNLKPNGPQEKTQRISSEGNALIVDVTLGESPIASVFTTKDKQLRWRYKANSGVLPFRLLGAVLEFDSIMATIAVSVPKSYQKATYHILGKALFAAFHTPEETKPIGSFRAVRIFVRKKAKERARLTYLLASMAAKIMLGLVVIPFYLFTVNSSAGLVALGGWFGSVGASISVLQRNASLNLDPWMSNRYLALHGIARIVLGFIFGSVFVMASKANFILGLVRDNSYSLLVLCIVAGFSERLIPELLSKFESSQFDSAKAKNDSPDQ